ncbi:MAG: hypothetical protein JWL95_3157 [Gemmatimonadetes bacterium]|nr:hypothetical protein [Gemmatimonadota bacterium]
MFIELVDALRCPVPHEESWLVVSATSIEARHVRAGVLGCPVCRREYPVIDGIADFRTEAEIGRASVSPSVLPELIPPGHLAAIMNLADPLGFAVLTGRWGEQATALLELVDSPPLLVVDPPPGVAMRPGLSGIRCGLTLPLAVGAARAVAVDGVESVRLSSAAQVTRVGGRLVAPVRAPLPDGVRELARDGDVWVAERESRPSALVTLHVRRG